MSHFEELLAQHEREVSCLLISQVQDAQDGFCGAFLDASGHTDTRKCGFAFSHLAAAYLIPSCRYYHDEQVKEALKKALSYLLSHQRPGGCLDLSGCNFASAPDTAFTMNDVINRWYLLEKDTSAESDWLKAPMKRLIETCSEGIMNGGFHTPNHRWAISACLKHAAKICGRPDFSAKADVYLGEGLDIDENGEFAERSTGTYNVVNDDQMIRLFLATGDKTYLQAARSNLKMMLSYIDPDDSVFTNNSTRQDYGTKAYLDNYFIPFLLTGYLLGDEDLAAYSEYCWQTATAHGRMPHGLQWLALYPELEAFGQRKAPDLSAVRNYRKFYEKSGIGRLRQGDFSCTVMSGKPNFLYFQHGENAVYLVIYGNVCEKRNFIPTSIEETEQGFRVKARADSWYYLPYDGDGPATTDWWEMNNKETRRKLITDALETTVDVALSGDGVDVTLRTQGLTGVPLRLEWGFLPGCTLRNENFVLDAAAGGHMTVCAGKLQAVNAKGETVSLQSAFARHNVPNRMGGAYPLSEKHFTVFFTDYSPFEHVIHIGTQPVFGPRFTP